MMIKGFSTGMYGWHERYRLDQREDSWDDIFRECAEAGMNAVEIDPTPELVRLAKGYGLSVSGGYIGLNLHEPVIPFEESVIPLIKGLAEAGGSDLVVNADPKGGWGVALPKTEDEFKRQGEHMSRIAAAAGEWGLKVSLHNHADEKHNAEGDLRSVIEYASADVGLCVDTGWAHVAGADPIEWIRTYPERIYAFHLRNQMGRIPTEDLLEGEIDMAKLARALTDIGYSGWLAFELLHNEENRPVRTMIEDVRRSVDYLKPFFRIEGSP
ncbi:sugar phosphate isomerase/epimerase family protein [Paenibacillus mendelii]|uniref:Sugar phosphate isomerase/epimerase family protein n=1 Tax=Paenibacillus mendelii TaxID=206163 RepID=A0ABV6JC75_9BACL|nr:sugar phosphate isomerase/epimerase [Paenibacillus mendelii]MCQ6562641.1 sugar phosphate isomerase/epimerase [Paenibacillus mendelii]